MPWVNAEMCTGCGVCVDECPVGAIALQEDDRAKINDTECIRCGKCHDACPQEAVRHDSERVPHEVAGNLGWVLTLLENFDELAEQSAFMERMVRFFKKEKKVNELTLAAIAAVGDKPAEDIRTAIHGLSQPQDT